MSDQIKRVTEPPLHTTRYGAPDNPKLDFARDLPMSVSGDFTVAVLGDVVITRPIADLVDPAVQAAIAPVRSADLVLGNLEQTIADVTTFSGYPYGVPPFLVMADPVVADDLASLGFDIMCRANNRLSDFGDDGNRETDAHLRRVGITPVGFGEHLAEAQAPVYRDTPHGRVGAIGITSSTNHGDDLVFGAAARVGRSNGRPGANHLRVSRTITLPGDGFERLKDFVLDHDYAFPGAFAVIGTVSVWEDRIRIGSETYVRGERAGYSYEVHPDDRQALITNTRNAAVYSNFTVVTVHHHQWQLDPDDPKGGMNGETLTPPDFLVDLARACIDHGADIFCAHGPFDFRAIEIHRGKPIFYGLGSFARQAYLQQAISAEMYHRSPIFPDKIDPLHTTVTDAELLYSRVPRHPGRYFRGATPIVTFRDSQLAGIALHPIDLGLDGPAADLGVPRRASPELGRSIIADIARESAAFGTTVVERDGLGIVEIPVSEEGDP